MIRRWAVEIYASLMIFCVAVDCWLFYDSIGTSQLVPGWGWIPVVGFVVFFLLSLQAADVRQRSLPLYLSDDS